jgi:predicted DNA-binding transcriptional regulator YafY
MSYLAITQRIAYIDSRLRHRQDYPSAADLARGLVVEHGEEVTTRTIQRDIEKMRGRGRPLVTGQTTESASAGGYPIAIGTASPSITTVGRE